MNPHSRTSWREKCLNSEMRVESISLFAMLPIVELFLVRREKLVWCVGEEREGMKREKGGSEDSCIVQRYPSTLSG